MACETETLIALVSDCCFADCHYIDAVTWTQQRVEKLWDKLEKLGIRPERLQLEWISAAEGTKFARVMKELEELRRQVTKEEIEKTVKVLSMNEGRAKAKVKRQQQHRERIEYRGGDKDLEKGKIVSVIGVSSL